MNFLTEKTLNNIDFLQLIGYALSILYGSIFLLSLGFAEFQRRHPKEYKIFKKIFTIIFINLMLGIILVTFGFLKTIPFVLLAICILYVLQLSSLILFNAIDKNFQDNSKDNKKPTINKRTLMKIAIIAITLWMLRFLSYNVSIVMDITNTKLINKYPYLMAILFSNIFVYTSYSTSEILYLIISNINSSFSDKISSITKNKTIKYLIEFTNIPYDKLFTNMYILNSGIYLTHILLRL